MKSGARFSIVKDTLKLLKFTSRKVGQKLFELQSYHGKLSVSKYWETKVKKDNLIAKEQIELCI